MSDSIRDSRASWNRTLLNLDSDEALAQILDRGSTEAWHQLYRLAEADAKLRARIHRIVLSVPLPLPGFWLAALASLGEPIDWNAPRPDYYSSTSV